MSGMPQMPFWEGLSPRTWARAKGDDLRKSLISAETPMDRARSGDMTKWRSLGWMTPKVSLWMRRAIASMVFLRTGLAAVPVSRVPPPQAVAVLTWDGSYWVGSMIEVTARRVRAVIACWALMAAWVARIFQSACSTAR